MSNLKSPAVKKVRKALSDAGFNDTVIELDESAASATDAAKATGAELGSIVKTLVFLIGEEPVLALIAGDHVCLPENLPRALNLEGEVRKTDAEEVKAATGFSIGGVAPVALALDLPVVIDVSLKRFDALYAAAGHPHCVFPTTVGELKKLTGGIVSYNIAAPAD
ncbi:MAG: YbaK/EbsC family protein [Rhodospirillaceae bacterium]|jgi:prolyl-tRNA editing enzyme YbaK/EbsC (Cys-tRNA(Pro) deacylase)|nr:YbaK/EbsC family protein [Rhodospirillaceae bacterium]MBT4218830.1 YbaK/EbsC family protein [Rhodospirillaceae bacterium]MBT4463473.1 YbaK/EbsC family protein [Rhodospirillaceae bacterium]MBT5309032.1 YbaK/EbsC family protein [Rhodospirillaceae bacterium]MBT7355115.1 YbaK/EbsC family protein [Rhodospirillaceae bacterium]